MSENLRFVIYENLVIRFRFFVAVMCNRIFRMLTHIVCIEAGICLWNDKCRNQQPLDARCITDTHQNPYNYIECRVFQWDHPVFKINFAYLWLECQAKRQNERQSTSSVPVTFEKNVCSVSKWDGLNPTRSKVIWKSQYIYVCLPFSLFIS